MANTVERYILLLGIVAIYMYIIAQQSCESSVFLLLKDASR